MSLFQWILLVVGVLCFVGGYAPGKTTNNLLFKFALIGSSVALGLCLVESLGWVSVGIGL